MKKLIILLGICQTAGAQICFPCKPDLYATRSNSFTCLGTIATTHKEYQEAMDRCDFIRDSTKAAHAVIGKLAINELKKRKRK